MALEEALALSKDEDPEMRAMAESEISELKERTHRILKEKLRNFFCLKIQMILRMYF